MFSFIAASEVGGEDREVEIAQLIHFSSKKVEFPSGWTSRSIADQSTANEHVSDAGDEKLCNGVAVKALDMELQQQQDEMVQLAAEQPQAGTSLNAMAPVFVPKFAPLPVADAAVDLPAKGVSVGSVSAPTVPPLIRHTPHTTHATHPQVSPRHGYATNNGGQPKQNRMLHQQAPMPLMEQPLQQQQMQLPHMAQQLPENISTSYMPTVPTMLPLNSYPEMSHQQYRYAPMPYDSPELRQQPHPAAVRQHHRSGPGQVYPGFRASAPNDTLPATPMGGMSVAQHALSASHPLAHQYMGGPPSLPIGPAPTSHMVPAASHSAVPQPQVRIMKREKQSESRVQEVYERPQELLSMSRSSAELSNRGAADVAVVAVSAAEVSNRVDTVMDSTSEDRKETTNSSFFLQFGDNVPYTISDNKSVTLPTTKASSHPGTKPSKAVKASTKPSAVEAPPTRVSEAPPVAGVTKVAEEIKVPEVTTASSVATSAPAATVTAPAAAATVPSAPAAAVTVPSAPVAAVTAPSAPPPSVAPPAISNQTTKDVPPQSNGLARPPPSVTVNGGTSGGKTPLQQTTATPAAAISTDNGHAATTQASPPAPTKTWANLFAGNSSPANTKPAESLSAAKKEPVSQAMSNGSVDDIGAILYEMKLSQVTVPLQARRLVNQANWCYVNATLQALLACPPFYHVLKALPRFPPLSNRQSTTPVLDAMVEFVNEFSEQRPAKRRGRELRTGEPFEPKSVYNVLSVMKTSDSMFARGKQEDAEEFLTCLLNKINEEVAQAIKQHEKKNSPAEEVVNGHEPGMSDEEDDGQDWEQVGPKNKSVVTHSNVDKTSTPILKIFGGQLRSSLHTGSNNPESVTLEPFFTVPLNVQENKTVMQALHAFVSKESIDDYTCPTTKQELDAHRKLTFEHLPPILILHLKCFVYDKHGGSQKVLHNIEFGETLDFDKDLLSKKYVPKDHKSYKLFAVVYHSGTKTTGGHYHTDVFHMGLRSWVRFDDNSTTQISHEDLYKFKHPCVPYLLYYRRCDTQQQPTAASAGLHKHGAAVSN